MKKIISIFIIVFISVNLFAQTNMIIRTTDGNTHSYPILEVDSVYYQEGIPNCGTVTDYDGNTYQTITIGTQCWMAENLKVTHYPNGDAIPLITDNTVWSNLAYDNTSDAYSYYDNSSANATTYGALYTYAAAIGDNWARDNTANQGVCPDGWHLPTDNDWKQLEMALGMSIVEVDAIGWRGTNEGSKLAGNAALWDNGTLENNADFGTSGFSALPGGFRDSSGYFNDLGSYGYWWSATELNSDRTYFRYLVYNLAGVTRYVNYKSDGFSVRCIRD